MYPLIAARLTRLAVLAVLALVLVLPGSSLLAAPTDLERSLPPSDGVVDEAPVEVGVWFTEAVDPDQTWLLVVGPDGGRVDLGDTEVALVDRKRRQASVSLRSGLARGEYTVHWRSDAAIDEDDARGHFGFTLAAGPPSCTESGRSSPVSSPPAWVCVPAPVTTHLGRAVVVNGMSIDLQTSTTRARPNDLTVRLADDAGVRIADAQVTVRARHLEMDHGETPQVAAPVEPGRYVAEQVKMGMTGEWRIAVDVILPNRPPVTVFFLVDLEGPR